MKNIYFFVILFFISFNLFSQTSVEACNTQLSKVSGKEKVNLLNKFASELINTDPKLSVNYALQAKELAENILYKEGIADALFNSGTGFYYLDEFEKGINSINEAITLYNKEGLREKIGIAKGMIGEIYIYSGEYSKALDFLSESRRILEEFKNNRELARCNNNLGNIQKNQGNFTEALSYYKIGFNLGDDVRKGDASLAMGQVFVNQKKYSEADKSFHQAIIFANKNNDQYVLADAYIGMGEVSAFFGQIDSAKTFFNKALAIKEEVEDEQGIAVASIGLGNLQLQNSETEKAVSTFMKAVEISRRLKIKEELKNAYLGLSNSYHGKKRYDSAYYYLNAYNNIYQELLGEEATKKLKQIEDAFTEEKNKQKLEKEKLISNLIRILSLASILILCIVIYILFTKYKLKQKANIEITKHRDEILKQQDLILQQNEELQQQKEEIKTQMEELEEQSKFLMKMGDKVAVQNQKIKEQMILVNHQKQEIMDSIHYAKRIQMAILPPPEYISKHTKSCFILYRPKDIVSGDFYWIEMIGNRLFFSAVDCTGHGVPGAFMSIVGNNGLDRATREQRCVHPAEILDLLDDFVVETLRQTNKTEVKDGMDIALCSYDITENILEFAGANNPLYIIREKPGTLEINGIKYSPYLENEKFSLYEVKGDKQPIGAVDSRKKFTNNIIKVIKGDRFYVFTDGYADQFGGPNNKKFMYKNFKKLLLDNCEETMLVQHTILEKAFEEWQKGYEQIDDITIVGINFD